jgi:hypothetical protein
MLGPSRAVRVDLASTRSLAADGPAVFSDCRRNSDRSLRPSLLRSGQERRVKCSVRPYLTKSFTGEDPDEDLTVHFADGLVSRLLGTENGQTLVSKKSRGI